MRVEHQFRLIGYVVMPEHVHLLISEPKKGTPSTALQVLKQRVSRKMRKRNRRPSDVQLRLGFAEDAAALQQFWQARFYDFNVYSGSVATATHSWYPALSKAGTILSISPGPEMITIFDWHHSPAAPNYPVRTELALPILVCQHHFSNERLIFLDRLCLCYYLHGGWRTFWAFGNFEHRT